MYEDVVLGAFGPIVVDAVSEIPTHKSLVDKREIQIYVSSYQHVREDKIFFMKQCFRKSLNYDERRVHVSIIDLYMESNGMSELII